MKKLMAVIALGAMVIAAAAPVAEAHGGGAALALSAFAAFTALVAFPFWALASVAPVYPYPAPAYAPYYAPRPAPLATTYAPTTTYAPAVTYAPPPAPAVQREVVYANGRHVLYGDGVRTAYQWVWVPNPPTSPAIANPPAPPASAIPPPPAGSPPPPPPNAVARPYTR